MSYLSSKDIRNLSEAYRRVHNKDEYQLFFEDVINSLTEDIEKLASLGHDFSEYTWYELYESFFDEVIIPEFDDFGSILNTLNESSEELTEEKLLHLTEGLPNVQGLLSKLNVFKKAKPKPSVTTSPTILDKFGKPIVTSTPVGGGKGTFSRIGDWWKSVTTPKPKPAAAAAPAAPAAPATSAPVVTGTSAPAAPATSAPASLPTVQPLPKPAGYKPTPSGLIRSLPQRAKNLQTRLGNLKTRTWDRLPAPVRGTLKYGTLGFGGLDVAKGVLGKPTVSQGVAADVVGRTGDVLNLAGKGINKVARQFGNVEAQSSAETPTQLGQWLKDRGQDIRSDLERKNQQYQQDKGTKPKPKPAPVILTPSKYKMPELPQ